jgi:hypothetical protein
MNIRESIKFAICRIVLFCCLLFLIFVRPTQGQGVRDREGLRSSLKGLWDSFETFEFQDDDDYSAVPGGPASEPFHTRTAFASKKGGRHMFVMTKITPEGEFEIGNFRENGQKRYRILHGSSDPPGLMQRVMIHKQPGSAEVYEGENCMILHFLWPGEVPLHQHLKEGATVEFQGTTKGRRTAVVESRSPDDRRWHFELDEEHDWLPKSLEVESGRLKLKVEKFAQENGRWFPVDGEGTRYLDRIKGLQQVRFKVTRLKINQPIPDYSFELPALPAGVTIIDENDPRNPYRDREQGPVKK